MPSSGPQLFPNQATLSCRKLNSQRVSEPTVEGTVSEKLNVPTSPGAVEASTVTTRCPAAQSSAISAEDSSRGSGASFVEVVSHVSVPAFRTWIEPLTTLPAGAEIVVPPGNVEPSNSALQPVGQ